MEVSETPGLESAVDQPSEIQVKQDLDQHPAAVEDHKNGRRGTKRPAEDYGDEDDDDDEDDGDDDDGQNKDGQGGGGSQDADIGSETQTLSKNQLRKLKRRKLWEEKKAGKRTMRKEKRREKLERKRLERDQEMAAAEAEGREPIISNPPKSKPRTNTKVPVSVVIDCQFEEYMMEKEWVSLSNQVTRCYSDNKNSEFSVHMSISSYGGAMKNRYETVLQNQHKKWKDVRFVEGDFIDAARHAKELMGGPAGGKMIDTLQHGAQTDSLTLSQSSSKKAKKSLPVPEPEAEDVDKSIVYLTADSPYTLERLEPNTCYVIGGIIDKNREKGLCYKIARERNVRTAKLPIGEFMEMQSRHILATNHVMEIMLKWLELGDWGAAFMKIIPQRKGGKLKDGENTPGDAPEDAARDEAKECDVGNETNQLNSAVPEEEPEQQGESTARATQDASEVEGDNSEKGLQKNSLDQQRWSAPPAEVEKTIDPEFKTVMTVYPQLRAAQSL